MSQALKVLGLTWELSALRGVRLEHGFLGVGSAWGSQGLERRPSERIPQQRILTRIDLKMRPAVLHHFVSLANRRSAYQHEV